VQGDIRSGDLSERCRRHRVPSGGLDFQHFTPESPHFLSRPHIPKLYGLVLASRSELAVGAKCHASDPTRVTFEGAIEHERGCTAGPDRRGASADEDLPRMAISLGVFGGFSSRGTSEGRSR